MLQSKCCISTTSSTSPRPIFVSAVSTNSPHPTCTERQTCLPSPEYQNNGDKWSKNMQEPYGSVSKPIVPLVNIKIAGKWMFIPLKMVLIGIDPYPYRTMFWPAKPFISHISKLGQRLAMLTIAAVVGGLFCQKQVFCEDGALFCMHPP